MTSGFADPWDPLSMDLNIPSQLNILKLEMFFKKYVHTSQCYENKKGNKYQHVNLHFL